MHLLGAKGQRKVHTGGGEPASGFAFQGHVLSHLAYNRCTNAATRPRGRPGPPNFSRGSAAAHPAARWGMPGDTRGLSFRSFGRGAARPSYNQVSRRFRWCISQAFQAVCLDKGFLQSSQSYHCLLPQWVTIPLVTLGMRLSMEMSVESFTE